MRWSSHPRTRSTHGLSRLLSGGNCWAWTSLNPKSASARALDSRFSRWRMSKHPAAPSYIEQFSFPTIDKHSSTSEAFQGEKVILVPYRGNGEFDWTVLA